MNTPVATPRPSHGRPASLVMDLERLGSMSPSRLSFARTLLRSMVENRWSVDRTQFALDEQGFGEVIYRITTPHQQYHVVIFAQPLADELRTDRVIAEAWDVTFCLVEGDVDSALSASLAANIPLQEAGRQHPRVLVISRANKSVRNFAHFIAALSSGEQPDIGTLKRAGYLYRTTAVYGNGKFGIADYGRVQSNPDFSRPFSPQMAAVYILRQFSIDQVEHIARCQAPDTAVAMDRELQRYVGIGNSTGLGMAPFLINHPQLIHQWIANREHALCKASSETPTSEDIATLQQKLAVVRQYFDETWIEDPEQAKRNLEVINDIDLLSNQLNDYRPRQWSWNYLQESLREQAGLETQELFNSLLIDLYPACTQGLEDQMAADESIELQPEMSSKALQQLLEDQCAWAIHSTYDAPDERFWFWYKSTEKEEPRLGERGVDSGSEKELPLAVAPALRALYQDLIAYRVNHADALAVEFAIDHPEHLETLRRAQTMAQTEFGEIRSNLWHEHMKPMHLLRAKLSFLGANRFDPKGDRWVRVTFFQGSPLLSEVNEGTIDSTRLDDWSFALAPKQSNSGHP